MEQIIRFLKMTPGAEHVIEHINNQAALIQRLKKERDDTKAAFVDLNGRVSNLTAAKSLAERALLDEKKGRAEDVAKLDRAMKVFSGQSNKVTDAELAAGKAAAEAEEYGRRLADAKAELAAGKKEAERLQVELASIKKIMRGIADYAQKGCSDAGI